MPDSPPKIMVIRHAEKPDDQTGLPPGFAPDRTTEDPHSLTVRGWQRADVLPTLFGVGGGPVATGLAVPKFVFAAGVGANGSKRPQETIAPLAQALGLVVDTSFLTGTGGAEVVQKVLTCPGPVLVCWEHHEIPSLVGRIPGGSGVPQRWQGRRFDVVWVFDQTADGSYAFRQVPQLLLEGDSDQPIKYRPEDPTDA